MPINNFSGNTFVAFTDISGFKEMMKQGKKAIDSLMILNQTGYDILSDSKSVNGFFLSDAGILFVRGDKSINTKLKALLCVIEKINRRLLEHNIMLTTSICYGQFKYQQRLEFPGIEKNPIYGNAYVDSYLDNENGKPKIQPGQCRLIVNNIARESSFNINNVQNHFKSRLKQIGKYYYFYWMVDTETDIEEFEERYTDSYKLKYQGMLTALKFIS